MKLPLDNAKHPKTSRTTRLISLTIRAAFKRRIAVAPDNYDEIASRVTVYNNLQYPSAYPDNLADIYIPNDTDGPLPIVLWIHGGAFVGGSKRDADLYATTLAAEGFAVVCMDYRRAPEAQYPVPLIQTNEVYRWLNSISDTYSFDMNRLVLAGDSAGAHIAAQFAAIQSNAAYAGEMNFEQIVPLHTIKAVMFFCAPFDVAKIDKGVNPFMDFFIAKAACAYFGTNDWAEQFSYQATISNHVTSDFPPTFISDGNTMSFEDHGMELADVLRSKGVFTETFFTPIGSKKTTHEYQFIMNTDVGKESFRRVTDFLRMFTK